MSILRQKTPFCIFIFLLSLLVIQNVYGKTELTTIVQKHLDVHPLDVASSRDGNMIFILSPGQLIIYSSKNNKIINRSAIDDHYDRISYAERNKTIILTSRSSKLLKIIHVEQIHKISLSGLPFKGPANAPVTIVVFDDYQ